ncbi:MAG: aminoacyl-tRNA hydrolase [Bacteroidales bacterium]|nr:aminoacyl-tRNA hydrolase [Bacteroidales bacterium]MBR6929760.1 aminoacyl-tRNA hydrolase [Bacteroidales bacterium]
MKYLIACLGNIGAEYDNTRHNIGFKIADRLAKDLEGSFTTSHLAQISEMKYKGKTLVVIKPTTYMNLSGKAVKYWLGYEKIPIENLLVVNDDIALPLGTLRLRKQGADGGHNGLTDIIEKLGTNVFCRLRFGLGDDFPRGRQIDFVLGQWKASEEPIVDQKCDEAVEIIKSFVTQGPDRTMNLFNKK